MTEHSDIERVVEATKALLFAVDFLAGELDLDLDGTEFVIRKQPSGEVVATRSLQDICFAAKRALNDFEGSAP